MNILFVNTNRMQPPIGPIGLDYLADAVASAGHQARLLDLCFADDLPGAVARGVREADPDVIGVTVRNTDDCYLSSQAFFLPQIREIIGWLRGASDAPVVLGGVGFSIAPEAALEFCGGDFGIVGEGELALSRLLEAVERKRGFDRVPGLVYRQDGRLRRNPAVLADLASLPAPRRALVDNARYFSQGGQAGFETKRGCAMGCIYCADPVAKGRTVRLRPPAQVVQELQALLRQGIDHFHTCDSEFNLPPDHAREVCLAIIAAGLSRRIRWYAYCAPKPFDVELADLFQHAGCAGINFGVDSGCEEVLRRLGRHFTAADLAETARLCRQRQIPLMFDLLVGGPGETPQTLRQTIELMRRLEPDCVGLSVGLRVYADTPLAHQILAQADLAAHPDLHGCRQENPHFLKPLFYISAGLGDGITACVRELVGGDARFFLPESTPDNATYNYNENTALVRAIAEGARGAYWDILRKKTVPRRAPLNEF